VACESRNSKSQSAMRRCNKVRFHVSRPDDEGKSLCHIRIFGRVCSYCACDKQVHRLYTLYAFIKSVANVSVVEDSFSSTWFLFTYEGKCAVCQLFLRDETKTEGAFFWSLLNIAERQKSISLVFLAYSKSGIPEKLFCPKGGKAGSEEGVACLQRAMSAIFKMAEENVSVSSAGEEM